MALSESEALALVPPLFAAAVIGVAWGADAVRLTIHPYAILIVSALTTAAGWTWLVRWPGNVSRPYSAPRLAGFALIVIGFAGYVCRLAWPSLLPVTEGPDLIHHLTLIHFIQRGHALPHDPEWGRYLGEMSTYTPGSHLLAALIADWLHLDALRVVHPLVAAAVAVKAGILYNVLLRLLPPDRACAPQACAGTLLLLVPHDYLLQSFMWYGFYSQVIAETFAVATLWALIVWCQEASRRALAVFAVSGIAVALCWPVWLAAPLLALAILVWLRTGTARDRSIAVAVASAPIAVALVAYSAGHAPAAGLLGSGGKVLVPAVGLFGWRFLALTVVGIAVAARRRGASLGLVAFAAACLAQIVALYVVQTSLHATNPYLAFKSVHLFVYPLVVLAGLGLEQLWHGAGLLLPGAWRRTQARLGWVLPILVLWALSHSDLPRRPVPSPITAPVYRAGLWTKEHLPAACVDYMFPDWVTGYWLHLDVLGNARAAERMRNEPFIYNTTVGRWIESGSMPYAIVGDLDALPGDVRPNVRVLQRFGRAAVVERVDGKGRCTDHTPPIDVVQARER